MYLITCKCGVRLGYSKVSRELDLCCLYCAREREQFRAYALCDGSAQKAPWYGNDGESYRVHRRGQCEETVGKIRDIFREIEEKNKGE